MVRTLTLLGLLLWMAHQAPGSNQQVVPPRITTDPAEFARGQVVTISATFQQRPIRCPAGKGPTRRFAIRIYDDYAVPTEPVWVDYGHSTKSREYVISTVGPDDADAGKMVTRTFYPIRVQGDQTERIYVVLWHACATKRPVANGYPPEPLDDQVIAERYGGRFYRYSCPGTGKIPTGKCAYRPE